MDNLICHKDAPTINHRSAQKMNLKCLADHIVKGDYEEQLLPQEQRNKYPHKDEHIACDFNKNDDPKKQRKNESANVFVMKRSS